MKIDPICGMDVAEDSEIRSTHNGEEYLFCATACKEKFDKEPAKFANHQDDQNSEKDGRKRGISAYTPLYVIVVLSALAAVAKQVDYGAGWQGARWMHDFMGVFLIVFSMVKLFDLKGFSDGFRKYDLLASKSRLYALVYPFLELALGFGYLSMWQPRAVYLATIALLLFGALGVFNTMRQGKGLNCACMGKMLDVPLSTVTLTEDLGMAAMAAAMLLFG